MNIQLAVGSLCVFVAAETNTGPVTINGELVLLRGDAGPLMAGDIVEGATYLFDPHTGKVFKR
jgi:hypothetical protein